MNKETIKNNHEVLFIYDAKMCNPNGDPDNENKPRMDYDREMNLVSDLRLKRYIRDYVERFKDKTIFVCKIADKVVNATERLNKLAESRGVAKIGDLSDKDLLSELCDVRMFGATMPIKGEKGGSSRTFTGPVQFNWGYSLNPVSLCESNGITSHFSSESEKTAGAMGKDYRVDYSLIAFHGIISAKRAGHTNLTDEDVTLLDEAMIKSIPLMATRSKIGQYPRLYLRIEYNSPEFFIGDLRKYVDRLENPSIRFVEDYTLNMARLKKMLEDNRERIGKVYWWKDDDLKVEGIDLENGEWLDGKLEQISV